jgi:hypothetical protein
MNTFCEAKLCQPEAKQPAEAGDQTLKLLDTPQPQS